MYVVWADDDKRHRRWKRIMVSRDCGAFVVSSLYLGFADGRSKADQTDC